MKIKLSELRKVLRKIIKEAHDTPTLSDELVPSEQEFDKKFPNWSGPNNDRYVKHQSPASVKAKQVSNILTKRGVTTNAANKKKVIQQLIPYIEEIDPIEMFEMGPEDIADRFSKDVLNLN